MWQPEFVDCYRYIVCEADTMEVDEFGLCGEPKAFSNVGVGARAQIENVTSLDETLFLDGSKQAVQDARWLFDWASSYKRAFAATPLHDAGTLQLADRVPHRVTADAVLRYEFSLRWHSFSELAFGHTPLQIGKRLCPQRN